VLSLRDVTTAYGVIVAVQGVTLEVPRGRVVALLGANGAGKTTLLHTVCGVCRARSGSIEWAGAPIGQLPTYAIARRGVLLVPEGRQVLAPLSVRENLELGRLAGRGRAGARAFSLDSVYQMFPHLLERAGNIAGSLSGGEQQMLAIGRALMGGPEILLLDEPSLGLAPLVVAQVFDALKALSAGGLTILLVEQNAQRALEIAHYAYVMERGRIVDSGPPDRLRDHALLFRHYLGPDPASGAMITRH
jgi:branched-chain amino acid transport system ATP-binding protein